VPLFSTVNHSTQTYTPNAGCWAADWDFSGVAVWNSRSNDFRRAGTLITRRHIAFTSHYRFVAGDFIRFRGADGIIRQYKISAVNHGPYWPATNLHSHYCIGDVCVAVLNENVHESIAHYPITGTWVSNVGSIPNENPPMDPLDPFGSWPQNSSASYIFWGNWMGGTSQPAFCGLWVNQNRHARVVAIASAQSASSKSTRTQADYLGNTINRSIGWCNTHMGAVLDTLPAFMADYAATYAPGLPVGGDSSSPIFFPVSSTSLALIATFTANSGGYFLEESLMNAIIAATDTAAGISTGLTVTVAPDPTL